MHIYIFLQKNKVMESLIATYKALLKQEHSDFVRYMHDRINWNNRLIGIVGPRGVGKTTLIIQHIINNLNADECLYVNADDFYFSSNKIVDLANNFSNIGGKYLFIDEIHKHDEWARELKLIYDYHPDLHVVFSGSSILDITKGANADLSRRAVIYKMQGLSFREYLKLFHNIDSRVFSLAEVLENKVELDKGVRPLQYFKQYLKNGYYPFALNDDYKSRLQAVVNQTLESDIPQYANMHASTSRKLRQLLAIISQNVPFKPNMKTIGESLGVSRNNVADYLLYIEQAGLISQLRDGTGGIRSLAKVDKVYLDNTNLMHLLNYGEPNNGNVRETFFMNQLRVDNDPIASSTADFQVGEFTFEVGGKNKGKKQIQSVANGFVVKDDIEYGALNTIPLWTFGMLY